MSAFHLAQVNLARPLAPLDSPRLEPFIAELEPINARADVAPGFVWRHAEERYEHLRVHGPTPFAFTFQRHFPAPDADGVEAVDDDRDLCPA